MKRLFSDELQQTKTLAQSSPLTTTEKITDLGKMKTEVQHDPDSSRTRVVILAGLDYTNRDQLMVYSRRIMSDGQHQKLIFQPIHYQKFVSKDSIEFNAYQTLTLFQHILCLPFGSRLVTGISDNDLVDADKFFNHFDSKKD